MLPRTASLRPAPGVCQYVMPGSRHSVDLASRECNTGAVGPYVEAVFGVVATVDGLGLEVVGSCDGVTLVEGGLGGKRGGEEGEKIEEGGELHDGRLG